MTNNWRFWLLPTIHHRLNVVPHWIQNIRRKILGPIPRPHPRSPIILPPGLKRGLVEGLDSCPVCSPSSQHHIHAKSRYREKQTLGNKSMMTRRHHRTSLPSNLFVRRRDPPVHLAWGVAEAVDQVVAEGDDLAVPEGGEGVRVELEENGDEGFGADDAGVGDDHFGGGLGVVGGGGWGFWWLEAEERAGEWTYMRM